MRRWVFRSISPQALAIASTYRSAVALFRGWAPFAGLLAAYELMRDAAAAVGMPPHNLAGLDRALFGGYQPTLVLQAAIDRSRDADLVEDLGSMVYATHFMLPIAVGAWLWIRHREAFQTFGLTLVVLCALAFATYVAAPTSPPWLAQPQSVQHLISIAIARSGLPPGLTWLYAHHDYNLYAAFPSLHAGFPVVAAAAAWQVNRRVGILLGAWALVVWVSVVYLGEHYVADIVGGMVYAAAAILIVRHVIARRTGSRSANVA